MVASVFIDGEAGTTGLQIRERLAGRRDVRLIQVDEARRKDPAARAEALNDADAAILCLPDDAARESAALLRNPKTVLLDASTAHRTHADWTYGFPEMTAGQAERVAGSRRIAVPGCYPTGTIALVRPLVTRGLLPASWPVAVNAVSGYSGGGRQMIEAIETPDKVAEPIHEPFFLYGLGLAHKHVPEMHHYTTLDHPPLFVPSVARFRQGMTVSIPLALWALPGRPSAEAIQAALVEHYAGCEGIEVAALGAVPPRLGPEIHNGTNAMTLALFGHAGKGELVMTATYDNLGKGASGAAVQCLELALGLAATPARVVQAA